MLTHPGPCEQEVDGCISMRVVGWTVGKGHIGKSEAQEMAHGIDAEEGRTKDPLGDCRSQEAENPGKWSLLRGSLGSQGTSFPAVF